MKKLKRFFFLLFSPIILLFRLIKKIFSLFFAVVRWIAKKCWRVTRWVLRPIIWLLKKIFSPLARFFKKYIWPVCRRLGVFVKKWTIFIFSKSYSFPIFFFLSAAGLYSWFLNTDRIKDPDSFYHIGMAMLTAQQGPITHFKWLPFTVLANAYADQHFIYHVLLIPFVKLMDPLLGLRIATAIFAGAAVTAFYLAARALRLRPGLAAVATLLLMTSAHFVFRMNLAKAGSLSVVLLMLGLIALLRRKPWMLFVISFIYVWTHSAWPLLVFVTAIFVLTEAVLKRRWNIFAKHYRRLWLASGLGSLAGIILNPFFPQNLKFFWYQTVQIALVNYGNLIKVGREWDPMSPVDLFKQGGTAIILCMFCLTIWLMAWLLNEELEKMIDRAELIEYKVHLLALTVISVVFCYMTLGHQRHIEYFLPFLFLMGVAVFDWVSRCFNLQKMSQVLLGKFRRLDTVFIGIVIVFFMFFMARDIFLNFTAFHYSQPFSKWNRLKATTDWMHQNIPANQVIFHAAWDDFPTLFYRAPEFRYISGLDPTFLYVKDKDRFAQFADIANGKSTDLVSGMKAFDASYLLVMNNDGRLLPLAAAAVTQKKIKLIYSDNETRLYQVISSVTPPVSK